MTAAKLTPRKGDRVLVKIKPGRTYVGDVLTEAVLTAGPTYGVRLDGMGYTTYHASDDLQVVDRVPVEWPEGWSGYKDYPAVFHEPSNVAISKDGLRQLLLTGPDMLARFDELMGGAE